MITIAGCATNKDAFLNRTFHSLVTRDNSWFNADLRLNEAILAMEKAYPEDFDELLPIFIDGTEEQARSMVPELEICIEKCATVIDRHSMEIGGVEKNSWIDDAYYVVGRSQYYKRTYFQSERTFDHIHRRYKDADRRYDAKLWQARAAIRMEQYANAQSNLDELRNAKELPKKFRHDLLSATQADLDLLRGRIDHAIVNLERAVEIARNKREKVRWAYLLGQLYARKNQNDKAIQQFGKVVAMSPPYEIGFHAKIQQALGYGQGNTAEVRKKLRRMLRDDKHMDHFDMIHYALAELDLKENQDSSAIVELKASARKSTRDTRQKAKTWLKLADLHFDDKIYPTAQAYYDSTSTLISEKHARHQEVLTRAEVLGELVEHLAVIAREDSLQAFAQLDPVEQERRIRRLIRERENEEEAKAAAEAQAREVAANQPAKTPTTPGGGGGNTNWYFYNPNQLGRGANEFRKKWGARPNEDDWRRKDKSGSATFEFKEDNEEDGNDGTASAKTDDDPEWKKPENYTKDLPTTPEALETSNNLICEAYYQAGMIYKEKLKDESNAIESFELLNSRFDECRFTPESHYQLYRIYLERERASAFLDFGGASSDTYAAIILERWPNSEFARLVRNPDQLQADEAQRLAEASAYEDLYRRYREGFYIPVITGAEEVITTQPDNHLLAKYHLLKAMAVGGMRERSAYRSALSVVVAKFPDTDEAKAARLLLGDLDKLDSASKTPPKEEKKVDYIKETAGHFTVLLLPKEEKMNEALSKVSDFNRAHFRNKSIPAKNMLMGSDAQLILIGPFETKEAAMEYYDMFKADKRGLVELNKAENPLFVIGQTNYQRFYTNQDTEGYMAYFTANYLATK